MSKLQNLSTRGFNPMSKFEYTDEMVNVVGTSQASAGPFTTWGSNITSIPSARLAGRDAYAMAGVTAKDIDFAEVHDCFTFAEIMAVEDLGFFEQGRGAFASADG